MTVRLAVIGCVSFSKRMLKEVQNIPDIEVAAVVTRESSPINSDFYSLEEDAISLGIPFILINGRRDQDLRDFLLKHRIEIGLCVGWSYLLPQTVLEACPRGVIGYHPADLPNNRGRHPIIWALALGLKHTASTFFLMNEEADAGAILDQVPVNIQYSDSASTLYNRITNIATEQVHNFIPEFVHKRLKPVPQNPHNGNSWRKRSAPDGQIDWRMSYDAIHNLVRALTSPYPGATCKFNGDNVLIWRVERGPDVSNNLEPGKILNVSEKGILVKNWDGSVLIKKHEFTTLPLLGDYLL